MTRITMSDCREIVAEHYRIPKEVFLSGNRTQRVARPRMMAMTLALELTDRSTTAIGRHFGNRDHTTAMHAIERIYELEDHSFHIASRMEDFRLALLTFKAQQEVTLMDGAA